LRERDTAVAAFLLDVFFWGSKQMNEGDPDKRPDMRIDYQSAELHGLLAAIPPLMQVSRAAKFLAGFAGITLFLAGLSLMPDGLCLLMCLNPLIIIMGAASAMMFCANGAAACIGIKSRWPNWVAFVGALLSLLILPSAFFWGDSGGVSPSGKKFGTETIFAGTAIFSSVSYFAAMYRASEYGRACNDRLLCIYAIVAQLTTVLTASAVCLLLIYYHTVKDSESAAGQGTAAVISLMSFAVLVVALRAARTVRQPSLQGERDVRGRSDS
jgi:hypothetical protein